MRVGAGPFVHEDGEKHFELVQTLNVSGERRGKRVHLASVRVFAHAQIYDGHSRLLDYIDMQEQRE
jgi:hypothetical protein